MRGLSNKVAIVTGAATLIGARVAKKLACLKVSVVIADIDEKGGGEAARAAGNGAVFQLTDLRDDAQVKNCVEAAVKAFGGIDFLVNVACSYVDDALNASRADWLTSFDVNVVGGVMLLKAARPIMAARGGGAVGKFGRIHRQTAPTRRWVSPVSEA